MSIGRSERLVGRDRELAAVRGWLARVGEGPGGVYVITGEPGVGKSRLAAEAVAALPSSWLVIRGRAADRDRPAPFRPIAEALLAASRHRPLPDDPDVRVFAAVLGHLVPAWRRDGGGSEPVVVVAEAVLRVLGALAAPLPAVMLVEDVQWADPETLAVLDYLADNVTGQRTAVVITVRSDTPSPGLAAVRDLAARRVATLVDLARLGSGDVTAMACECLGTASVGADIRAFLDRSGGCRSWSRNCWPPPPGTESWVSVRAAGPWPVARPQSSPTATAIGSAAVSAALTCRLGCSPGWRPSPGWRQTCRC